MVSSGGAVRHAWRSVGIFCCLYALSGLDRVILALLVAPVRAEIHISDTQIGLLLGAGFGLVYALAGLPIAHLVDRANRRVIVIVGVVVWSLSTIASGFAGSFEMLLLCRAGLAVGEAVLGPSAASVIYDLFPAGKRAAPMQAFLISGVAMGTGSFIIGGGVLHLAELLSPAIGVSAWRLTLIATGLPGLVLAVVFAALVFDPPRRRAPAGPDRGLPDREHPASFLSHLRQEWRIYGPVILSAAAVIGVQAILLAWLPTMLAREHGLAPATAGLAFGTIGAVASISGMTLVPFVSERWRRSGRNDALPLLMILLAGVIVVATTALTTSSMPVVLTGAGAIVFAASGAVVLPSVLYLQITPANMQARIVASTLLAINLLGLGLSPWLTAVLSTKVFSGAHPLSQAMATVGATFALVAIALIAVARKPMTTAFAQSIARDAAR